MKSFKPFTALFSIVFIVQLYGEYTANIDLVRFSKPFITILLMAGLLAVTRLEGKFKKRVFAGLAFALIGDVLLMFQEAHSSFFIFGLIAFLICHLFYISAFHLDMRSDPDKKNPYFIPAAILLAFFAGTFFLYIRPSLESLQIPVLIYSFIISVMTALSIGRFGKVNIYSFRLVALGAFLFMLSDCALAYNKFVVPVPNAGIVIMGTYMLAQYLIVYGAVTRNLLVKRTEVN